MKKQKIIYSLMLFSFTLTACKKHPSENENSYNKEAVACGVKNPIENLPWLNALFQEIKHTPQTSSIVLYEYEDKNVINIYNGYSSSLYGWAYYCDGTYIDFKTIEDREDYLSNRKKITVLFGEKLQME